VSDRVPEKQRGVVSTWVAAPNAIGTVLGVVLVGLVFTQQALGYLVIAILLVVCAAPFIVRMPDQPLTRSQRDAMLAERPSGGRRVGIDLRANPDFSWALASRILVYLGNALGTALLLYYFGFALHIRDAEDFLVTAVLIYVAVTLVMALIGGTLSDRIDRRRVFVVVGGVAQGVAALLLAFLPSPTTALVGAGLLGLGWGVFLSVDQALTTGVLPDAETRGRHLGVMNIAVAVPQNVGPLAGALLVALTGGFFWLFFVSGVAAILGALCVLRVRSVP
jgi:MFS family permease